MLKSVGAFPILKIEGNLYDQIEKVEEEVEEVRIAETLEDRARETFDLIQSCIGLLGMLDKLVDLNSINREHIKKLANRGWTFEGMLNIEKEVF